MRPILGACVLVLAGCTSAPPQTTAELDRIERQLTVLYRPLLALVAESKRSVEAFLKTEGRQQILPTDRTLTDAELQRWIQKFELDLMPRNEKMCALIRAHLDLVEGSALPRSWQALLDHEDGWREDHQRWKKEGVEYPFHARTSFPRTLQNELIITIALLEERRHTLEKG